MQEQRGAASGEELSDQSGNGKARVSDVGRWSESTAGAKEFATHRRIARWDALRPGGGVSAANAYALGLIDGPEAVLRQKQAREAILRKRTASLNAKQAAPGPEERAGSTDEAPRD
eukprot:6792297-Prymnesium_polylepis.1